LVVWLHSCAMLPAPAPLFEDLLQRLASEHRREVGELRAEIARLKLDCRNDVLGPLAAKLAGTGGAAATCANKTAGKLGGVEASDDSDDPRTGAPDEEALAAAFGIVTDLACDRELLEDVAPWGSSAAGHGGNSGQKPVRTTRRPEADRPEALALWNLLMEHARREIRLAELPQVHNSWKEDGSSFSFKNLIGIKHQGSLGTVGEKEHLGDKPFTTQSFRHLALSTVQVCFPRFPLSPSSKLRMCWDFFGVVLLVHDLIMIPMMVYENHPFVDGLPDAYERFTQSLDFVSAFFWSFDIAFSFVTSYHSTAGFVETRMGYIACHYIKSWFPIDFSIVAVDWATIIWLGRASGYMRLGKTASRIMRVARLLRFVKMSKQASELMARINSEYLLQIIGLLRLVLVIMVLNHYIACFWLGITRLPNSNNHRTWADVHLIEKDLTSLEYAYFTSLHWSLTQFTPASMEVFPQNVYERFFNVIVIICAFGFISSFVSSITSATTHLRNINAQAVARDTMIRRYFSEHGISHGLAARVWHFLRQKRAAVGKRLKTDDLPILQQLPARIRDELRQEVHGPVVMRHPLLRRYLRHRPAALRKICSKGVQEVSLKTGQELKLGSEARRMVYVVSGALEFHASDFVEEEDRECPMLEQGEWACEAALWADRAPFDGHFVAAPGGSDLLLLDAEVFRAVARENYESRDPLVKYSSIFMQRFRAAMQDEAAVQNNAFFNSPEVIKEMMQEVIKKRRSFVIRRPSSRSDAST